MILALLIFTFISLVGIIILKTLTKEERIFALLPAGMLFGTAFYIFLLNQLSHLLPGSKGIILATLILAAIGVFLTLKLFKSWKLSSINLLELLIPSLITIMLLYFIQARMETILPVGDSTIQWAYAAIFARGNFPLMTPWQPDMIPTYHLGAYFFGGAIHSVTNLPWITIHTLINIFFLFSASTLAVFLFWERKYSFKNLWSLLVIGFVFISFGILIILIPGNRILNFPFSQDNLIRIANLLTALPQKGTAGAALVDINSLSYLPARSLGIGLVLLILYFFTVKWRKKFWKIILTALTAAVLAFTEESVFLPLFLTIIFFALLSFIPSLEKIKIHKKELILITLICLSLILLQRDLIADQFINKKDSAFNITLPLRGRRFFEKFQKIKNDSMLFSDQKSDINFITLSPFLLFIFPLIYGLLKNNKELSALGIFSLINLLLYLLIDYKYDLSNNIRFYNFSYIAAGLGISYVISFILRGRSIIWNIIFLIVSIPLLIIPTTAPAIYKQTTALLEARKLNIAESIWSTDIPKSPFEQISSWASENLPSNSRLLILAKDGLSPEASIQFQYKGIYTTLGPQNIRVLRQQPGTEYFDLSLTLNPSLFRQTKTEYLYIESSSPAYQQLPKFRKDDLENSKYFEVLKSIKSTDDNQINFFRIYRIRPEFLSSSNIKEIKDGTLEQLVSLIPNNATVYVSDYGDSSSLNFWYRMASILSMKDKQLVRNPTQTDYMAIETFIPYQSPENDQVYDYYILSSIDKPKIPSRVVWSNIHATAWKSNLTKE